MVAPGTHPSLLFSAKELPRLRRRAKGDGLAAECYGKVVELARGEAEERRRGRKLNAMALVYQIERDNELGRQAVELFKEILAEMSLSLGMKLENFPSREEIEARKEQE